MAGAINHRFVSAVPDEGVASEYGPDELNDSLVVSGGLDGQAMVRRTSATDGWELINLGAPLAFINATQAANSGTGETDLHSFTLLANHFNANKRSIRLTARGSFAANANVKTLRVKWGGGATIVLNPVTGSPNNVRFKVEIVITRTGVDAQDLYIESLVGLAAFDLVSKTGRTEDDGVAQILKITGQSGTASNDILLDHTMIEFLN
jgi:hypothetical protein